MMKIWNYIDKKDDVWHDSDKDMPARTSFVEFMDDSGTIYHNGLIEIDVSGHFPFIFGRGYSNFLIMKKWRFASRRGYDI